MKRSFESKPLQCAQCGADRLIPLTVHPPRAEYKRMQSIARPVRAELKCIVCGHRHRAHPSVLLAG